MRSQLITKSYNPFSQVSKFRLVFGIVLGLSGAVVMYLMLLGMLVAFWLVDHDFGYLITNNLILSVKWLTAFVGLAFGWWVAFKIWFAYIPIYPNRKRAFRLRNTLFYQSAIIWIALFGVSDLLIKFFFNVVSLNVLAHVCNDFDVYMWFIPLLHIWLFWLVWNNLKARFKLPKILWLILLFQFGVAFSLTQLTPYNWTELVEKQYTYHRYKYKYVKNNWDESILGQIPKTDKALFDYTYVHMYYLNLYYEATLNNPTVDSLLVYKFYVHNFPQNYGRIGNWNLKYFNPSKNLVSLIKLRDSLAESQQAAFMDLFIETERIALIKPIENGEQYYNLPVDLRAMIHDRLRFMVNFSYPIYEPKPIDTNLIVDVEMVDDFVIEPPIHCGRYISADERLISEVVKIRHIIDCNPSLLVLYNKRKALNSIPKGYLMYNYKDLDVYIDTCTNTNWYKNFSNHYIDSLYLQSIN